VKTTIKAELKCHFSFIFGPKPYCMYIIGKTYLKDMWLFYVYYNKSFIITLRLNKLNNSKK